MHQEKQASKPGEDLARSDLATLDQLVARHLKHKHEEADGSHIMLKTGGKLMTLKRVQQQQQMPVSGMITMTNDASLSRNGLLKVAKNVRPWASCYRTWAC